MHTINIQTTNYDIIEAIKALVAKDPKGTTISYDEPDESVASIPALDEAIAEYERGEVERFKTFEEFARSLDA